MKTIKQAAYAALTALMLAAVFSLCASATSSETIGDYVISVGYDQGIMIEKYNGSAENLVIPSQMTVPSTGQTLSVFGIDEGAFESNLSIVTLTIPNTVIHIGQEAFSGCVNMKTTTFGSAVKEIGVSAFSNCSSLVQVNLPDSLKTLGSGAFEYCAAIETVDTGDGIETLISGVFSRCTALYKVVIGLSVKTLDANVFLDCDALDEVRFNAKATDISASCFDTDFTGELYCYYGSAADNFAETKKYEHEHYKLTGLTAAGPDKTTYYIGETVNLDGLTAKASYRDAPERDVTGNYAVNTTYEDENGRFIAVTYTEGSRSATCYIPLTFKTDVITGLAVSKLPNKLTYYNSDTGPSLNGIALEITYESGKKETVTDTALMTVSGFDSAHIGTQTLTVTCKGMTTSFEITVRDDVLTSIAIAKQPDTLTYRYKDKNGVKLDGIALEATYESGRTETITDTSLMTVTGFNNTRKGVQTIGVVYGDYTANLDVTVKMLWWQWLIKIILFGWIWY